MTRFAPVDLFDEYTPLPPKPETAKEPTRLTIRVERLPSRWRTWRAWAGLLLAIAAAAVAGQLIDSRRSSTRHYLRAPEPKAAIPATTPPHARRQPRLPSTPSSARSPGKRKHARHSLRRKPRRRVRSAPRRSAEHAASDPTIDVAPDRAQPSIAATPTTGETRPGSAAPVGSSRPYSRPSVGEKGDEQFAYLGR
jgi:hypothetical protein